MGEALEKHTVHIQIAILIAFALSVGVRCDSLAAPAPTAKSNTAVSKTNAPKANVAGNNVGKLDEKTPSSVQMAEMKFPISSTDKKKDGTPTKAGALFIKGWTEYAYRHNSFEGKKSFKAGLAIDPGSASNNFAMWYLCAEPDGHEAAIKYLNAALKRDPNYIDALLQKAYLLSNHDDDRAAIKVFSRIIELDPKNVEARAQRGDSYFELDEIELAKQDLLALHAMAPEDPETLLLKAELQYYDAQYQWARHNCNKVVLAGANPKAYFIRSKSNARLFDFYAARSDIKLSESKGWTEMDWWKQRIDNFEYDHLHAEKDPAKRWVLACSAPISEYNNQGFESLPGAEPTPERREEEREKMARSWKIHNAAELKAAAVKCTNGQMCNPSWIAMREAYKKNPAYFKGQKKSSSEVQLIQKYGDKFGDRGILAYELGRVISSCRWGYTAGYLTEEEAFAIMLPAAVRIQKLYKSWDDYVESYFVGRRFWNSQIYDDDPGRTIRVQHLLTVDPNGLHKIPWNTKLVYQPTKPKPQGFKWPWESSN